MLLFATANGGSENLAGVQYSRTPVHACLIDATDDWNLRSVPCTRGRSPVPLHRHTRRRSAFSTSGEQIQVTHFRDYKGVSVFAIVKVSPMCCNGRRLLYLGDSHQTAQRLTEPKCLDDVFLFL